VACRVWGNAVPGNATGTQALANGEADAGSLVGNETGNSTAGSRVPFRPLAGAVAAFTQSAVSSAASNCGLGG
jgi:hypothetical protein